MRSTFSAGDVLGVTDSGAADGGAAVAITVVVPALAPPAATEPVLTHPGSTHPGTTPAHHPHHSAVPPLAFTGLPVGVPLLALALAAAGLALRWRTTRSHDPRSSHLQETS